VLIRWYSSTVLIKGVSTSNYFVTNGDSRPEPPRGGTNVQTWTRTYYSSYRLQGDFALVPPNRFTNCTSDASTPAWEVKAFGIDRPCFTCPPTPWIPNVPVYKVGFRLRNLINNFDEGCSFAYTLSNPAAQDWIYCGINPEDAPFLPATWVHLDWDTHMLGINQTWQCKVQGNSDTNSL